MNAAALSLALLLFAVGLADSGGRMLAAQERYEFTEVHMGMPVRIVLHAGDAHAAADAARAAFATIARLDDTFSDYRPSSELRRLEMRPGTWTPVSDPLFDVLARAIDLARLTGGAFDPTVGPLTARWREARRTGVLPAPAALDSARRLVGWRNLRLDATTRSICLALPGMRLDVGGIAKGYILQAALAPLRRHGVHAALLEAGGDIVVGAAPPGRDGWTIDVNGADSAFAARAASLTNAAIATSGPVFQYLEIDGTRHSHVLDPRTGLARTHPFVVHVIAADAAIADALSTTLGVIGPAAASDLLLRFPDVEVAVTGMAQSGGAVAGRPASDIVYDPDPLRQSGAADRIHDAGLQSCRASPPDPAGGPR